MPENSVFMFKTIAEKVKASFWDSSRKIFDYEKFWKQKRLIIFFGARYNKLNKLLWTKGGILPCSLMSSIVPRFIAAQYIAELMNKYLQESLTPSIGRELVFQFWKTIQWKT